MFILKRILSSLILFSFLLSSFIYSQSVGTVTKTGGGVGLAVYGVKTGKKGLKHLTKYGQELV
ncbi:MAG: hypothetical protein LBD84_04555, partial [Campylobacteraceae bacterium]|nr:hypothetical protein [Campylobacteraceae bacterium]